MECRIACSCTSNFHTNTITIQTITGGIVVLFSNTKRKRRTIKIRFARVLETHIPKKDSRCAVTLVLRLAPVLDLISKRVPCKYSKICSE